MNFIEFNSKDIDMPLSEVGPIKRWIHFIASTFDKRVGNISYLFTSDREILDINKKFLNHDYYTDIITFDYSKRGIISGDIYISLDTVRTNAQLLNADYDNELMRVIIHGILHLCGINDKGPGEREIMEMHENQALAALPTFLK